MIIVILFKIETYVFAYRTLSKVLLNSIQRENSQIYISHNILYLISLLCPRGGSTSFSLVYPLLSRPNPTWCYMYMSSALAGIKFHTLNTKREGERRERGRRQRRQIKIGSKNKYLYKLLDEAWVRFAVKGNEMLHKRSSKMEGRGREREGDEESKRERECSLESCPTAAGSAWALRVLHDKPGIYTDLIDKTNTSRGSRVARTLPHSSTLSCSLPLPLLFILCWKRKWNGKTHQESFHTHTRRDLWWLFNMLHATGKPAHGRGAHTSVWHCGTVGQSQWVDHDREQAQISIDCIVNPFFPRSLSAWEARPSSLQCSQPPSVSFCHSSCLSLPPCHLIS